MSRIKLLVVCQWPLGGIRTYLKYNYQYFCPSEFEVTLLARPVAEKDTLAEDMKILGVEVVWAKPVNGRFFLAKDVVSICRRKKIEVIHSHGFQSAFHVSLVNSMRHLPHLMTVHGIVEEKYFKNRFSKLKKRFLGWMLRDVDVAVSVSDDIRQDVQRDLPQLAHASIRWETIHNGIDVGPFSRRYQDAAMQLRERIGITPNTFLFGFFGRFMPQKGFDYLIDAVELLSHNRSVDLPFAVLAVGSGDYEKQTLANIKRRGLQNFFRFLPFCPNIAPLIQGCDTVVMPSVWEAFGLVAAEVLCSGVPLIASDCVGLREAVADTPTIVFESGKSPQLAEKMQLAMENEQLSEHFREFRNSAIERYDVRHSAHRLVELTREMLDSSREPRPSRSK